MVQPATVVRWHRTAWSKYWRWKSRGAKPGRPRIDTELIELIRQMTRENPRWGHMRVFGELRKLGFHVSLQTVRRYGRDCPRDPSSGWRSFLENHRSEIWASDFFTVHTLWFQTLYVFFFIAHDRRTVMHMNVTAHPNAEWVWRQMINATPWGGRPRLWCYKTPSGLFEGRPQVRLLGCYADGVLLQTTRETIETTIRSWLAVTTP